MTGWSVVCVAAVILQVSCKGACIAMKCRSACRINKYVQNSKRSSWQRGKLFLEVFSFSNLKTSKNFGVQEEEQFLSSSRSFHNEEFFALLELAGRRQSEIGGPRAHHHHWFPKKQARSMAAQQWSTLSLYLPKTAQPTIIWKSNNDMPTKFRGDRREQGEQHDGDWVRSSLYSTHHHFTLH